MWKNLFFALTLFSFNVSAKVDSNVQWTVHFISYIGSDYSVAVKNKKVINKSEYQEMIDLADECIKLKSKWPKNSKITDKLFRELKDKISNKASPSKILELTSKIQNEIIKLHQVGTIPNVIPELKIGKALYNKNCMSCHGLTGNGKGELSKGLDPAPTNFLDKEALIHKAPFHFTNTITLGVPGTAMKGFKYSTKELWSLAHYVRSLTYGGVKTYKKMQLQDIKDLVNITHLSAYSDKDLEDLLKNNPNKKNLMKILRSTEPESLEYVYFKYQTIKNLRLLLKELKRKDYAKAKALYKKAYAYNFEYIEPTLKKRYGNLGIKTERKVNKIYTMIEKKDKPEKIEELVESIIQQLESL